LETPPGERRLECGVQRSGCHAEGGLERRGVEDVRPVRARTGLFGIIDFELFGQFDNVIDDRVGLFGHNMTCLGRLIGLPATAG
jgi:hypothetical protein